MKYNVVINQKAVIDNGLIGKLDIIDLAIFDFVYHFFNSDFEDKVTFTKNGVEYTEIRPSLLEKEMPLLKIGTKRTFINRMNNLINAGLIERYENNSTENRSGYKKGVNFSIFEFDKPKKQNSQGYENNFTPPMKTDSHNNNINDNIITDNNKEEIDKSISKKERAKDLVDLWNNETKDFPKVRKVSPDIINSIDKMLRRGYSYEDIKKAIILCNSLSDFYKGKERGKTWKATFQWLIHNTNDNFDKILNGALHTSQEQQRIYQSIMEEGMESQTTKYIPYTEGYHLWLNENDGKYYFTGNIINLADGYTKENRPNGAQVNQNGYTYTWNAEKKDWDVK